jgi:hypothetical protein
MNNHTSQQGEKPLRGILSRVGTPAWPDAITGYPRILISTDEESIKAVKRLPMLKPVVVIEEASHAQSQARIATLENALSTVNSALRGEEPIALEGASPAVVDALCKAAGGDFSGFDDSPPATPERGTPNWEAAHRVAFAALEECRARLATAEKERDEAVNLLDHERTAKETARRANTDAEEVLRSFVTNGPNDDLVSLARRASGRLTAPASPATPDKRVEELEAALLPFAKFACNEQHAGETKCYNCIARDLLPHHFTTPTQ